MTAHDLAQPEADHLPVTGPDTPALAAALATYSAAAPDFTPPRLTLRGIVDDLLAVDFLIEAAEGELTPALEAAQAEAFDRLAAKADGIRDYLDSLDAEAAHVKKEEARLAATRKRIERRADALRAYVVAQMQRRALTELPGEFTKGLRLKRSTASAILDEALLPDAYVIAETSTKIDKAALLKALRAGEEVPGAALVTHVTLAAP